MNRVLLLFLCLSIVYGPIWAQHSTCGYHHAIEQMGKKYPGYKQSIDKTFKEAKDNATALHSSSMTYTIPVVIHVVWNQEEERLDDSLITSQIDILNEDFRRLNDDADNIRDIFKDVVGDPMIQFTLEEVIYVETQTEFDVDPFAADGLPDQVKSNNSGGSDPWDNQRYLNIWICKIQPIELFGQIAGQILGYAYPPNNLDHWPPEAEAPDPSFDGVVLDYRAVGRNNPFITDLGSGLERQFSRGRTAVHEIGHYLGLRHIWGDGDGVSPNSCNLDDSIDDTPNAGSSALLDCNMLQNTCSSSVDDLPDMIENYMDLSDENCQNSFTIGQIELMRSVLENQRCQLVGGLTDCFVFTSTSQLEKVDIDIYPNPSNGQFHFLSSNLNLDDFDLDLVDISGKTYPVNIQDETLDLSQFNSGIYIISGTNGQQIFQQKLIKL